MKANFPSYVKAVCKSFLTAYALSVVFALPLNPTDYENTLDYIIASVYELLGNYDFKFFLILILAFFFYRTKRTPSHCRSSIFLSVFFALCLLLGQSYYETGSCVYCFGSLVNVCKFVLALSGFLILFYTLIGLLYTFFDSTSFVSEEEHFFTRHTFSKAFFIIWGSYMPFLLLSYPGNLCWDAIGQIEQVIGASGYSTHHPLLPTLIMGGLTKAGYVLFHSYEIGLFTYILFQSALLAAALAATIAVLSRRGAKFRLLLCLLLIYCITPAYSNMASTVIKDVPYCAFVIAYVVCLALLLEEPERIESPKNMFVFAMLQIGVILLRNNGLYLVLFSGIVSLVYLWKKFRQRKKCLCFTTAFAGSILAARLTLFLLVQACSASSGSIGEMLSVPFQQTARYLQLYKEEISLEERTAIEAILGDVDTVAASYDPESSDPVKALFKADASTEELSAYVKAWIQGLCKHPSAYFDAFFLHIYGWFTPSVSNTIRYEVDSYDTIRQGGLFPYADKLLIFYYRYAGRITLLGLLENIGAAVWALFLLTVYQKRLRQTAAICAGIPLWVSLLVCMASPCFFRHPRYAFPILFTLPFLYGFTLTGTKKRG
ncbi:MAG: DUF6020 family protein [Candidatus Gastranaerophilales bacterium]|nr:DUF6020 family protein [Candidatus Gastranaerophilales bacterium]